MKTHWDYTKLAHSYLKRPPYSASAIEKLLRTTGIQPGSKVCDVGAGTANLSLPLLRHGLRVVAIEPNAAMRALGISRTQAFDTVFWLESCGEITGLAENQFDLVCFGSSFNVVDQERALQETSRILKARGWFACLWNHRDLDDRIQHEVETIIRSHLPDYDYGSRRRDQTKAIQVSGRFSRIQKLESDFEQQIDLEDYLEAWESHATLRRQAGHKLEEILEDIRDHLHRHQINPLTVPYTTRVWLAQKPQ